MAKKKITKDDLAPENFSSKDEHGAALEEYYQQQPIYVVLNFIQGNPKKIKNKLQGKPGPPDY